MHSSTGAVAAVAAPGTSRTTVRNTQSSDSTNDETETEGIAGCASCGFPAAKTRSFEWGQKAKRRHTTGTGRMSYMKVSNQSAQQKSKRAQLIRLYRPSPVAQRTASFPAPDPTVTSRLPSSHKMFLGSFRGFNACLFASDRRIDCPQTLWFCDLDHLSTSFCCSIEESLANQRRQGLLRIDLAMLVMPILAVCPACPTSGFKPGEPPGQITLLSDSVISM